MRPNSVQYVLLLVACSTECMGAHSAVATHTLVHRFEHLNPATITVDIVGIDSTVVEKGHKPYLRYQLTNIMPSLSTNLPLPSSTTFPFCPAYHYQFILLPSLPY